MNTRTSWCLLSDDVPGNPDDDDDLHTRYPMCNSSKNTETAALDLKKNPIFCCLCLLSLLGHDHYYTRALAKNSLPFFCISVVSCRISKDYCRLKKCTCCTQSTLRCVLVSRFSSLVISEALKKRGPLRPRLPGGRPSAQSSEWAMIRRRPRRISCAKKPLFREAGKQHMAKQLCRWTTLASKEKNIYWT